jgi:hypothetical protein
MSSNIAEVAIEVPPTSNPLDVIPDEMPFDVPYGRPISLAQARAVIQAFKPLWRRPGRGIGK